MTTTGTVNDHATGTVIKLIMQPMTKLMMRFIITEYTIKKCIGGRKKPAQIKSTLEIH